jgi:hypothetical protein
VGGYYRKFEAILRMLNARDFKSAVTNFLSRHNIPCRDVRKGDRKTTQFNDPNLLFFNLSRTHGQHKPDIIVTEENYPCELKSPDEIYKACHFSVAHLHGYILQIIYGQCYSYADLFRPSDNAPHSIYLIIPKVVANDIIRFTDIEDDFSRILDTEWDYFHQSMCIRSVSFDVPLFANLRCHSQKYGIINHGIGDMLITKITYQY